MTAGLRVCRRPYLPAAMDEILAFCDRFAASGHDRAMRTLLIGQMVTDTDSIVDLETADGRAWVGLLLDALRNATDSAEFVVLGWDSRVSPEPLWDVALPMVEALAARRNRRRLGIGVRDHRIDSCLSAHGYHHAYTAYDMATQQTPALPPRSSLPPDWHWQAVDEDTVDAYYGAIQAAFGDLPGMHLAPLETFRKNALTASPPPLLLYHRHDLAGFIRVRLSGSDGRTGLIQAIGRVPAIRGQGLGPVLLSKAMHELADRGAARYTLDVTASNSNALRLYRRHGFDVTTEERHYLKDLAERTPPPD